MFDVQGELTLALASGPTSTLRYHSIKDGFFFKVRLTVYSSSCCFSPFTSTFSSFELTKHYLCRQPFSEQHLIFV